jgi:hypothetical protein
MGPTDAARYMLGLGRITDCIIHFWYNNSHMEHKRLKEIPVENLSTYSTNKHKCGRTDISTVRNSGTHRTKNSEIYSEPNHSKITKII